MKNPEKDWFGQRRVRPEEKDRLVRGVFDSVADSYDLMNDLMSGGVHRLWKDRFVRTIRPRPGLRYLDVAGGTGDIAFRIRKVAGSGADITVCDINPEMLRVGKARAADKGWLSGFEWIEGNAETLPFDDNSFDVYTIAFGLRNVTHIDKALAEAARVLKPGGRFYCLEFSHVTEPMMKRLYDLWSFRAIPAIGQTVAKDRESYQYLVESIRKFPSAPALARRMAAAGLKQARFEVMSFGVVALHRAVKI